MNRIFRILASTILLPGVVHASEVIADNTFKSPNGRYVVKMKELHHFIPPESVKAGNIDIVNHIRYAIVFLSTSNPFYYIADYNDVYEYRANEPPGPTDKKQIFSSITWSPKDDFAILPEEDWARAPGTSYRTAINLNTNNRRHWTKGELHMQDMFWADDFRVLGNVYDDCDDYVSLFDGKSGETKSIVPSKSPIGYSVIMTKNRRLIIKSKLDNCSTDEDEKAFIAECLSLDMDSLQKENIKCP
jgi:hypothetical protein